MLMNNDVRVAFLDAFPEWANYISIMKHLLAGPPAECTSRNDIDGAKTFRLCREITSDFCNGAGDERVSSNFK